LLDDLLLANIDIFSLGLKDLLTLYPFSIGLATLFKLADGLHVGQEDLQAIHKDKKLAIKLIRLKIKDKLLGLSTHNELEILEANELALDMIGLGAYKNTNTKDVSTILGSKISYLAKISKHPVCAIGGVKMDDIIENIRFNVVGSGFYEN
jgi:thiamine-phosphate pyrophosphorylase